jgi:hypothetical protein
VIWSTDQLDLQVVLERFDRHLLTYHEVEVYRRWTWRAVPFGPCPRCRWPAHTLGPNGSPFHPFCWGNVDEPPWWDQWVRRQVLAGEWS